MNFKNPYSRPEFKEFIQNKFLTDDFRIIEEKLSIEFKPQFIQNAELIGRDNSLDLEVYEVQHESEYDPRVGLSKDFFRLMANYGSKRALAIFCSPKSQNYRLSLATVELSLEGAKVKREYSNPRRYSFFLGPDAKVHTPNDFLIKKGKVKNFDDLKNRFSIEVVNKEFYKEIANWYFCALKKAKFPDDIEAETNGREISLIRLITRLIFIWFMKVRKLVPEDLFDENVLNKMLKDLKPSNDNYYKAVLQNLFFATLNTKQIDRRFRSEKRGFKGFNTDFGNHNVYRYENLFSDSEAAIEKYFLPIPFLNGGLFECLDYKTKTRNERKYIDGFTDNTPHQPSIPNNLFFNDDKTVDLNKEYGTTNKAYKVRGLINTLSLYNFTIDENDPNDADVALDPELLGRVFENLLASYNPETAKTARKSTGSYYTPRPIVDYMVDESLKQYFKTHLKSADSILAVGNSSDKDNLSPFFNPYEEVEIHKGNLPHWQQKNVWYFVTFRLADSLPAETVEQIKEERERWLNLHKKEGNKPYSVEELKEYYRLFSERIEKLLDDCRGSCVLREEKIAKIVADALLYFNNLRYELDDWVIMPNHVHVLVKPHNDSSLVDILHSWKSFTANEINKASSGKGQLWLHESYNHIVRNEKAFYVIKNYIRNNPSKAKLHLPNCAQSWTYHHAAESNSTVYDGEYVFDGGTVIKSKDALDTLEVLFSNEEHTNPFDKSTTERIVALIDSLRVIDPAVGSGAFPMRILNRLVFLLHKLDPDNTLWKQSQIDGIKKSVKDPTLQRQFIEQIERKFSDKNPDYGRKLYLIEKCIYGVDIQQIAVEIAKLRFFISLLVDEKISENSEIEPLPNLDFKLMQGNSLISSFAGIDFNTKPVNDDNLFEFDDNYKRLIEDFEELKSQYQNEPDVKKKDKLRDAIDDKLIEIFEEKLEQHYPQLKTIEENAKSFPGEKQKQEYLEAEKKKLFKKIGIDLEQAEQDLIAYTEGRKQKDFFLWDVYFAEVFAEKGGFDIVIGNPPYVRADHPSFVDIRKQIMQSNQYVTLYEKWDLMVPFYEKSLRILNENGINSFIASNSITTSKFAYKLQDWIIKNYKVHSIDYFEDDMQIFEAGVVPVVTIIKKTKQEVIPQKIYRSKGFENIDQIKEVDIAERTNLRERLFKKAYSSLFYTTVMTELLGEICYISYGLRPNSDERYWKGEFTAKDIVSDVKTEQFCKEYVEGKHISRYSIDRIKYIEWGTKRVPTKLVRPTFPDLYTGEKLFLGILTGSAYDNQGIICNHSIVIAKKFIDLKGVKERSISVSISKNNIVGKGSKTSAQVARRRKELEELSKNYLLKYLLAVINSKYAMAYLNNFRKHRLKNYFYPDDFRNYPIPTLPLEQQEIFVELVDKIISAKKQNPQANTKHLEDQTDIMVYKMYELTYEEVKIIDPAFALTEREYEKFGIEQ